MGTIKSARSYNDAEGIMRESKQERKKIRYRSRALYGVLYTCQCLYDQRMSIVHNQVYYTVKVFR